MNLVAVNRTALRTLWRSKMRTGLTMLGSRFGYYPAQKAARLDPIDALRYEG